MFENERNLKKRTFFKKIKKMKKEKPENSAKNEKEIQIYENEENPFFSPLCQKNCKICNSLFRDEIMSMVKEGKTYREVSDEIFKKYKQKISISSISRHMQNYRRNIRAIINRKEYESFNALADKTAEHQKQTLFLIKKSFDSIINHLENGTLVLGIDDFEKLVKLYYNTIRNPEDEPNDDEIIALFQKAAGKRGFDVRQALLFRTSSKRSEE